VERWNFILTLATISTVAGGIMVVAFNFN